MSTPAQPETAAQQAQARAILAQQNATAAQKAQFEANPGAEQALIAQYNQQQQVQAQANQPQATRSPQPQNVGSNPYINVGGQNIPYTGSQDLINYVTGHLTTTTANGKTYVVVPSIGSNPAFLAGDLGTADQYIGSLANAIGKPNASVQSFYQGPNGEAYGTPQGSSQAFKTSALSSAIQSIHTVPGGVSVNIPGLGVETFHSVAEAQTAANEVVNYEYGKGGVPPTIYRAGGYSYLDLSFQNGIQNDPTNLGKVSPSRPNFAPGIIANTPAGDSALGITYAQPNYEYGLAENPVTSGKMSPGSQIVPGLIANTDAGALAGYVQPNSDYGLAENPITQGKLTPGSMIVPGLVGNENTYTLPSGPVSKSFVGPLAPGQYYVSSNPTIAAHQIAAHQFEVIAAGKPFFSKTIDSDLAKAFSIVNTPLRQSATAYSFLGGNLTKYEQNSANPVLSRVTAGFVAGLSYEASGFLNFFAVSTGKSGVVKQNVPSLVGESFGFATVGAVAVEALPTIGGVAGTALRATTFGTLNAGYSAVQGNSPVQIAESFALGAGLSAGFEVAAFGIGRIPVGNFAGENMTLRDIFTGAKYNPSIGKIAEEGTLTEAIEPERFVTTETNVNTGEVGISTKPATRFIANPNYSSSIDTAEKVVARTDLLQETEFTSGSPDVAKVTGDTSPNFNPKFRPPPNTGTPIGDTFNVLGKESDIGKIKINQSSSDIYSAESPVQQGNGIDNTFRENPTGESITKEPVLPGEMQAYKAPFAERIRGYDFQEEYNPINTYIRNVNSGGAKLGGNFGFNYRPIVSLIGGTIPSFSHGKSVKGQGGLTLGGKVTQNADQSQYNLMKVVTGTGVSTRTKTTQKTTSGVIPITGQAPTTGTTPITRTTPITETTPITVTDTTPITSTTPITTTQTVPKLGSALDAPTIADVFQGYEPASQFAGFIFPEYKRTKKKVKKGRKQINAYKEFINPVNINPILGGKVPENLGGSLIEEFKFKRKRRR